MALAADENASAPAPANRLARAAARRALVIELTLAGMSKRECATRAQCAQSRVQQIRREAGICAHRTPGPIRRPPTFSLSDEEHAQLELVAKAMGKSLSETLRILIANAHGQLAGTTDHDNTNAKGHMP